MVTESPSFAVRWKDAVPACALAAAIAAVLLALGLMVPLLAMIGVGFLGVVFYRRRFPAGWLKAGTGSQIGAVSGVFTFGMFAILEAVGILVFHASDKFHAKLLEVIQQAAQRTNDPQAQAVFDYFRSPSGLVLLLIFIIIFSFFFFILLGAIGGAIGGAWLGRRRN